MKILVIKGSPSKLGNCAEMLKKWVEGVKAEHKDVEAAFLAGKKAIL